MGKIVSACGLSDSQLLDIGRLEEVCSRYEPLNMKLNWEMLRGRDESINDFLYYEGERLIGFLGLYDISRQSKEIEITGMVHPDFRRQGIFFELFDLAKQRCCEIKAKKMLLISEHSKTAGKSFTKASGAKYAFSEYRMKFEKEAVPYAPKLGICLEMAQPHFFKELSELDNICFGDTEGDDFSPYSYNNTLIAVLNGVFIGKIGLSNEGGTGYIFGFGVMPDFRGRGFGREILSLAVQKLLSENIKTIFLEVAVTNERALFLYKDCGFEEVTVYDYYEVKL